MAITDYIPNIFGSAAPSSYESLLGMGLLTPEQVQKQQNVANIQGLLGAGLSLAQGMGRTGPRRSAAENILGALAGGFGAAGGAYQQGLQNVVQQQQLQSAALTQQQAANRLKAIQQAAQQNPQLAQLFAINPEEATKQMIAMERAKMYGFGTEGQPAVTSAAMPTSGAPQVAPEPQMQPQAQPQAAPIVDPASIAKANDLRKKAGLAMSLGDAPTAKFLQDEADRIDPKEQLFYRDDKLVSSKRGVIGDFSGGKILTDEQATALGLDPNRGKWTIKGGIPSLVGGTEQKTRPLTESEIQTNRLDPNKRYQINQATGNITEIPTTAQAVKLTDQQAQAEGLSTGAGQKYFRLPSGEYKKIEGTGTTKLLTAQEITNNSLDPNKAYQITPDGNISVVTDIGTVANKADLLKVLPTQFAGVYPTLKPSVDALLARAPTMTRDQIVAESEKILNADADIRKELDPKLAAQRISERAAGAPKVYTGQLSKTTAGDVEKSVITTADAVTRLNNIQFSYKPEYQNIKFRTNQAWNTLKDKFGGLSPAEKTQLTQYSQYRQNALQNLNQTIKDITGAAMGVQEAERITATLPNAGADIFSGDSPTEFEAKLNNAVSQTKYALARKNYSLRKGLNWESTPLDKMPSIVNSRGAEIAKQYKLDPRNPADLQTINRQLAAEFGISF